MQRVAKAVEQLAGGGAGTSPGNIYVGETAPADEETNTWIDTSEDVGSGILQALLLAAHPVGSIYQSTVDTSPQTLFGGTWERLKDCFLLAAGDTYEAGATGGEATHTLTADEMPAHNHNLYKMGTDGEAILQVGQDGTYANANYASLGTSVKPFAEATVGISTTGGGAAHNNMPPYIAVYAWKRTA